MILIINNQSRLVRNIGKQLRTERIPYQMVRYNERLDIPKLNRIKGLILSGGDAAIYKHCISNNFIALMVLQVPVLGICLGHEILSLAYGGSVQKLEKRVKRTERVTMLKPRDPIFHGLVHQELQLYENHSECVDRIPESFIRIATSDSCAVEAMRHRAKPIYGFQFHPEASGANGSRLIRNFLSICEKKADAS
ncbi:hypothetical protein GF380_01795 [Candidatus Uhrbacteria bacterium]|nr:hypothetical protein [Candidatus Uhrbacteria bacterium]